MCEVQDKNYSFIINFYKFTAICGSGELAIRLWNRHIRRLKFQGDDWMEHCKVVEISHTCLYMDVMKVAISWEIRIWIGSLSIVRGCPPLLSPCTDPLPIQILYHWYLDSVDVRFYLYMDTVTLQLPLNIKIQYTIGFVAHISSHKCLTANIWIRMWIHTSVNARLVINI